MHGRVRDEVNTCYRHPGRETGVSCSECGRAICPDCMIAAPVGIKCPECGRLPRSARVAFKPDRAARSIVAALVGGAAVGYLVVLLAAQLGFFFSLIAAWLIGIAMGELVLRASGRYRGSATAWIAVGGAIWAYLFPLVLLAISPYSSFDLADLVASVVRAPLYLLGLGIAAFVAYRRVL